MSDYRNISDIELFLKLREADTKALDEIYARFSGLLYHHAKHMLGDSVKAQDILQDVFILLWKNASSIEIKSSFKAFLFGVTRNQVLKELRHTNYIVRHLNSLPKECERIEPTTDHMILEKELVKRFEAELDRLPEKMRAVFVMSRIDEYSHKEIAQKLNIAIPTVKNQITTALKILRVKLHLFALIGIFFI